MIHLRIAHLAVFAGGACLVAALATSDAHASDDRACGTSGRPWVEVDAEGLSPSLGAFVALLRVELGSRGFDLCVASEGAASAVPPAPPVTPAAPVATVKVSSRPDGVALAVEVRDAVTDKRVSRDVPLGGIPADGRPLTIALAADELLRASWAELTLRTAPPPSLPVPEPVTVTLRESLPRAPPSSHLAQLGVGFVWEQYARGLALYGADARLGFWVARRVELAAQLGLRTGPAVSAADGTAQPSAWSVGAAGLVTLTPIESRWGLDAVGTLGLERLTLVPTPAAGASGSAQSAIAVVGGLGAQGSFAIVPALRVGLQALALLPLRGVEGQDTGARFVGLDGAGWAAQLGVWSTL